MAADDPRGLSPGPTSQTTHLVSPSFGSSSDVILRVSQKQLPQLPQPPGHPRAPAPSPSPPKHLPVLGSPLSASGSYLDLVALSTSPPADPQLPAAVRRSIGGQAAGPSAGARRQSTDEEDDDVQSAMYLSAPVDLRLMRQLVHAARQASDGSPSCFDPDPNNSMQANLHGASPAVVRAARQGALLRNRSSAGPPTRPARRSAETGPAGWEAGGLGTPVAAPLLVSSGSHESTFSLAVPISPQRLKFDSSDEEEEELEAHVDAPPVARRCVEGWMGCDTHVAEVHGPLGSY